MHALYHFLINTDEGEKTIAGAQYGQFEGFVEYEFDDNNWHTPLILACKDGTVDFSEDNYRGGVDSWIEDRSEWNFDKAMEAAYDALYYEINKDLNLISESEHGTDREFKSPEEAAIAIAQGLAESYQRDLDNDKIEEWRSYARPRLARTYEALNDKYNQLPFFSGYGFSPYTARNFDLTDGDDYGLAILTVDVHT